MSSNLFAPRKQSLRFNDWSLSYICQLCISSSQVTKWLDICSLVASMHRLQGPLPDGDELFQWCRFYLHLLTWAGTQLHWLLCALPFVGCHGGVGGGPINQGLRGLVTESQCWDLDRFLQSLLPGENTSTSTRSSSSHLSPLWLWWFSQFPTFSRGRFLDSWKIWEIGAQTA